MLREEFKSNYSGDFKQRYQGTFGWYEKENKEKILVKLTSVDIFALTFYDEEGLKYTANADKGNIFEFIPVEKALYNYNNGVVLAMRKPARMWKRGLCTDNTIIKFIGSNIPLDVDFKLVKSLFGKHDQSVVSNWLNTQKGDVAFNNVFAVVGNKFYIFDTAIGVYKDNKITLDNNIFKQEVEDLVRDMELPIIVGIKHV